VLARFPGWGAIAELLNPNNMSERAQALRHPTEGLTAEEMETAKGATPNSHYTHPDIVAAMWDILGEMGFVEGKVMEPSAGSGLFLSQAPPGKLKWLAIDKDVFASKVLRYLNPRQDVRAGGLEEQFVNPNSRDVVITNVPFSRNPVFDPALSRQNPAYTSNLHNYFILKSLETARPGGLVAVITTHLTLDAIGPAAHSVRAKMAEDAEFLGAIRLPNNAFARNAGTEVVTDVIFLQKKGPGVEATGKKFQDTDTISIFVKNPGKRNETLVEFQVNEYFRDHPEMVIGQHSSEGKMYGPNEYTVVWDRGGSYVLDPSQEGGL
jgi:predicted RNA-binding protein